MDMGMRILCYHEIAEPLAGDFARQLDHFARSGYEFLSLSRALAERDRKSMVVSFDDGDHTLCEFAQPVLDERNIKAIIYLTTDYVLQRSTYRSKKPLRAVTWDQLGRWLEAGHEIGGHSHTHANFTACSDDELFDEMGRSAEVVRRELGIEMRHFAYPWGQHDGRTRSLLAGLSQWQTAATIDRGVNDIGTDRLLLKRDVIDPDMDLRKVRAKMFLGSQPWLYQMQKSFGRRLRSPR
jgi:peptidoglycan/xylan/chitin deacetylase (PgdA/CDA1 family)